jgi:hypothetical protein
MGADNFYDPSDQETFKRLKGYFDLILNTLAVEIDWEQYLNLLAPAYNKSKRFNIRIDITGTEKWRSMGVFFLSGGGYRHHIAASEQQQEEDNKNQILINDLDGIQILIKSE